MNDDYRMFDEVSDDGDPVEPDTALITAYLAHELPPMQEVAVQRRIANDPSFARLFESISEAWASPISMPSFGVSVADASPIIPPTREELDRGWQRFVDSSPASLPIAVSASKGFLTTEVTEVTEITEACLRSGDRRAEEPDLCDLCGSNVLTLSRPDTGAPSFPASSVSSVARSPMVASLFLCDLCGSNVLTSSWPDAGVPWAVSARPAHPRHEPEATLGSATRAERSD